MTDGESPQIQPDDQRDVIRRTHTCLQVLSEVRDTRGRFLDSMPVPEGFHATAPKVTKEGLSLGLAAVSGGMRADCSLGHRGPGELGILNWTMECRRTGKWSPEAADSLIHHPRKDLSLFVREGQRSLRRAFAYHFWMAAMTPIGRKSGNQHLHMKTSAYRDGVRRKLLAYHRHIQLGLIAQGLLQILSATSSDLIWRSFGSWIRTIRPGLAPSEQVTAIALRNSLPHFLADDDADAILTKFLGERIDLARTEGIRLIA